MKTLLLWWLSLLPAALWAQTQNWVEYVSPDQSFKVSYPSNWKAKTDFGDSKLMLLADKVTTDPDAMVAFFITPVPSEHAGLSIEEWMNEMKTYVEIRKFHTLLGLSLKSLGSYPGYTFDYTFKVSKKQEELSHMKGWTVIKDNYFFTVRYFSRVSKDPEYLADGDKIINSLSFPGGKYVAQEPAPKNQAAQNGSVGNKENKNILPVDSTNATVVKADELYPFQEGLAIIRKGTSYALINSKGEMVVPYNKYQFANFETPLQDEPEPGFRNGTCVVKSVSTGLMGLIDKQGKLIIPCENLLVHPLDGDGWAKVIAGVRKYYFINAAGTRILVSSHFLATKSDASYGGRSNSDLMQSLFTAGPYREEGLSGYRIEAEFGSGLARGKNDKGLWGYYDRSGKPIIPAQYLFAEPFHEGLACVAKKDEFGVEKYGFVSPKGETVIPFMFTNKPGNFSSGLAFVKPASNAEFSYCFINKKGEFVLKQQGKVPYVKANVHENPSFAEGYFAISNLNHSGELKVIDTNGKELVLTSEKDKITLDENPDQVKKDKVLRFHYEDVARGKRRGYIDLERNAIVYTPFKDISHFDPISGLALYQLPKSGSGYVNRSGKVTLKLAPPDKW